ncbi:hypothetical protein TorRG33x02_061720, partial [Trema orientale]
KLVAGKYWGRLKGYRTYDFGWCSASNGGRMTKDATICHDFTRVFLAAPTRGGQSSNLRSWGGGCSELQA